MSYTSDLFILDYPDFIKFLDLYDFYSKTQGCLQSDTKFSLVSYAQKPNNFYVSNNSFSFISDDLKPLNIVLKLFCSYKSHRANALQRAKKSYDSLISLFLIYQMHFSFCLLGSQLYSKTASITVGLYTSSSFPKLPLKLALDTGLLIDTDVINSTEVDIRSAYLILPLTVFLPNAKYLNITHLNSLSFFRFLICPQLEHLKLSNIATYLPLFSGSPLVSGVSGVITHTLSFPYSRKSEDYRLTLYEAFRLRTLEFTDLKFRLYLRFQHRVLFSKDFSEVKLSCLFAFYFLDFIISPFLHQITVSGTNIEELHFLLFSMLQSTVLYREEPYNSTVNMPSFMATPISEIVTTCSLLPVKYTFKRITTLNLFLGKGLFCFQNQKVFPIEMTVTDCKRVILSLFPLGEVTVLLDILRGCSIDSADYHKAFNVVFSCLTNALITLKLFLKGLDIERSNLTIRLFNSSLEHSANIVLESILKVSDVHATFFAELNLLLKEFIQKIQAERREVCIIFEKNAFLVKNNITKRLCSRLPLELLKLFGTGNW